MAPPAPGGAPATSFDEEEICRRVEAGAKADANKVHGDLALALKRIEKLEQQNKERQNMLACLYFSLGSLGRMFLRPILNVPMPLKSEPTRIAFAGARPVAEGCRARFPMAGLGRFPVQCSLYDPSARAYDNTLTPKTTGAPQGKPQRGTNPNASLLLQPTPGQAPAQCACTATLSGAVVAHSAAHGTS